MYLHIWINYIWIWIEFCFFNEFVDLLIKSYLFRDLSSTQDKQITIFFFLEYDLLLKIKQNASYFQLLSLSQGVTTALNIWFCRVVQQMPFPKEGFMSPRGTKPGLFHLLSDYVNHYHMKPLWNKQNIKYLKWTPAQPSAAVMLIHL